MAAIISIFFMPLNHGEVFAASYESGTYSVPVSLSGGTMGHNEIVSPCTVHISNGSITADIVIKRVKKPWHAPSIAWVETSAGRSGGPSVDENSYTNAFYNVPLPSLGTVTLNILTDAMSEPHEIEYSLYFDDSGIPAASSENSSQVQSGSGGISESSSSSGCSASKSSKTSQDAKAESKDSKKDEKDKSDEKSKDDKEDGKAKSDKEKSKKKKTEDKKAESKTADKKKDNSKSSSVKIIWTVTGIGVVVAVAIIATIIVRRRK